jgi:hypothetical protein
MTWSERPLKRAGFQGLSGRSALLWVSRAGAGAGGGVGIGGFDERRRGERDRDRDMRVDGTGIESCNAERRDVWLWRMYAQDLQMPRPRPAARHIPIDQRVELHFAGTGLHGHLISHAGQMAIGKRHKPLAFDEEDSPGAVDEANCATDARLRKVEIPVVVAAPDGVSGMRRRKRGKRGLPVQQDLNRQPVRHGYQFGDFIRGWVTIEDSCDERGTMACQQTVFVRSTRGHVAVSQGEHGLAVAAFV